MITLIFNHLNEKIMVTINGNMIQFGSTAFGAVMADISGIKLDYVGCCREFPDLETRKDWREESIRRFKDKIASFKTEEEKAKYIVDDLRQQGYKPMLKQKAGFRTEAMG